MPVIKLLKRKRDTVPTQRQGAYQKIYQDKRWLKLRNHKRRTNPLCERCEFKGKIIPTKEVHHKVPFDTGKTPEEVELLAFNWDNLMSVCEPCHEELHKEMKNC